MPKKALKNCSPGYVRNPQTNRCRKDCHRSPNTGRCLKKSPVVDEPPKRKSSSPKRKSPKKSPKRKSSSPKKSPKRKSSSPKKSPKRKSSSPKFVPTKIIITSMTGKKYHYVTKRNTDTYGDIKDAILPQLLEDDKIVPKPVRQQLVLADDDSLIFSDHTQILPSVVKLNILIKEREWNRDQQFIISSVLSSPEFVRIHEYSIDRPDKIEAFIWAMNTKKRVFEFYVSQTHIMPIINFLCDNTTIERLTLDRCPDTLEFLKNIGKNTFLNELALTRTDFERHGIVNALIDLLRVTTSIRSLVIYNCSMKVEDIKNLISILGDQHTSLQKLRFSDTKFSGTGSKTMRDFLKNIRHYNDDDNTRDIYLEENKHRIRQWYAIKSDLS